MLKQSQGFIAGQWRDSHSGQSFKVLNPFNNEELEKVADFDAKDVEIAIDNAHETFKTWRKSTFKQRSALLRKIGDLMLENKEELGLILTSEQGKPLSEATGEVGFAASFFHFFVFTNLHQLKSCLSGPNLHSKSRRSLEWSTH